MPDNDDLHRDLTACRALLHLWRDENLIKTIKLQVLLAVNAGLVVAAAALSDPGPRAGIAAGGCLFSAVWTLSIGRTVLSQQGWKLRLRALQDRHPGDPRFAVLDTAASHHLPPRWLQTLGGVSSKYYLLGTPVLLTLAWLATLAANLAAL